MRIVFFGLFFAALALPGLQMLFGFSEEVKLHGVERAADDPVPRFSLPGLWAEEFQQHFLRWWDRNIGYRGFFVRTDNQMNFSLFREISASYASPLVLGLNNNLFERLYVDAANGQGLVGDEKLRHAARSLAKLQALLRARGISFVLLISPSKASLYAEDVPKRYVRSDAPQSAQTNYARFAPVLAEEGVAVVDGRKLLERWKPGLGFPVFPKGGTHWSQAVACRVADELVSALRGQGLSALGAPHCEPLETKPIPEPFDRDLADLCNVWNPAPFYQPLSYPVPPAEPSLGSAKVLFVGGSFLWSILHYFDVEKSYERRDMFYYYSRRFSYPGNSETPIEPSKLDWQGDIFTNDAVVLEVNEANINTIGSGFIADALHELK